MDKHSWTKGPAFGHKEGNDPTLTMDVAVGDKYLVAIRYRAAEEKLYFAVIVATANGWDLPDGGSWENFWWSEVEYFIKLDKSVMPE